MEHAKQMNIVNGVDVDQLGETIRTIREHPELGKFGFRARNTWQRVGGYNRTTITDFHGVGEDIEHRQEFVLEADEPPVLLGEDRGANPVEHLLNALVTCLTTSLVYHAAARGIVIDELESTIEGDMDLRGFLGISDEVRKGYENIRVSFRVKSDASPRDLEECARFSPVFDVVTHGTPVDLEIRHA